MSRRLSYSYITLAYVTAVAVATGTVFALSGGHPLWVALAADVAATATVFAFSVAFDNSSFYDPYWSVAPIVLALYWTLGAATGAPSAARQAVVLLLIGAWAIRLTYNFLRGWKGLVHEDWRYRDIRATSGRAYWLVSFLGIHLFPTLVVFGGCLPVYVAVAAGTRPFGALDGVATAVTAGAMATEAVADAQLRRFVTRPDKKPEEVLATGLWAYSRHPNYFGEMLFWWGLYLFALAADPAYYWTGAGALAITLMFRVVSLPLIEKRMCARRPAFAERIRTTSAFVPWFPRQ